MRQTNRILAFLLIFTGGATLLYWLNYFLSGDVRVLPDRWYSAFEDAFPAADGWMAACSLLAGIGLLTGHTYGARFGLLAGATLIFLAAMDITFNLENGLYALTAQSDPMKFEVLVNLWTAALGGATIALCWCKAGH